MQIAINESVSASDFPIWALAMNKLISRDGLFTGRHCDRDAMILRMRWYLGYKLGLRELVKLMAERGVPLRPPYEIPSRLLDKGSCLYGTSQSVYLFAPEACEPSAYVALPLLALSERKSAN